MTDYELISLYTEQVSLFFTVITVLTTILFSFLAGMYFIAGRINMALVIVLSALFGVVSFGLVGAVYAAGARAVSLGEQMVMRINAQGSDIAWLFPGVMPDGLPRNFYYFFLIAILLALLFVMLRRREVKKRKAS